MTTICTTQEHATARGELFRLASTLHAHPHQDQLDEVLRRITEFEAEAHQYLKRDLTDVRCWLLVCQPTWLGDLSVEVPPGPEPRTMTALWATGGSSEDELDMVLGIGSAAFHALGYVHSPEERTELDPLVSHPETCTLPAHRKMEGYLRIERAFAECRM